MSFYMHVMYICKVGLPKDISETQESLWAWEVTQESCSRDSRGLEGRRPPPGLEKTTSQGITVKGHRHEDGPTVPGANASSTTQDVFHRQKV